ncbi:MAG TPA: 5'/3'-nucleotidase SurE [Saprospiraceae bacterium]|nr:5'/3'-nucleotidase SurE [Saprospiraceae bacterium]
MSKPLILVTNDDGIVAPGIKALINVAKLFGEVFVVAPDKPQSGKGHGITISDPIRLRKVDVFEGVESYECSGTPVDCVKLAKTVLLKGRNIDICLSGINHGSNSSINIIYSGTMSAAMEAHLEGIPSIGFSLLDYSFDADFSTSERYIAELLTHIFHKAKIQDNFLLNVNIPALSYSEIKGFKVCRQSDARWIEEYVEATDPKGLKYYWLTGHFNHDDSKEDTDNYALEQGYISIVPSQYDLTDYQRIPFFKFLESIY